MAIKVSSPLIGALVVSSLVLGPVVAQEAAEEPEITFQATELAPGLYMIEGVGGFGGGNVGLLTGEDGVVLIDDSMPPLTTRLLSAVDRIVSDPVDFVINTHVHGDHVGGNATLGEAGAWIVAHENVRERLLGEGLSGGGPEAEPAPPEALPVITFGDAVTFHLNGQEARVVHVDRAHTDGDAIIHFRDAKIIHAGDTLFNRLFPFIDLDTGGSLDGYIAAQERILDLADEDTQIIPGHGSLASTEDLEASIAMLKTARSRIGSLIEEGKSVEEIVEAAPLKDYQDWSWDFITTERMTRQVFRSLVED